MKTFLMVLLMSIVAWGSRFEATVLEGEVDGNNSTTTPLAGSATFTGTSTEVLNYGVIFVNVYADVASGTDGLEIEQSSDGTNWDHSDCYTVPAATGKNYSINPCARYVRVKYTNGGSAQATFRLQTIIKGNARPSSHRIQDAITDDDDAELQKSILTAKANGSGFVNIAATASNNLRVTDAESGLAIAMGNVVNTTFIHKFGNAPDFDQIDGDVTIWDGAEDGTSWEAMDYTFSTSADIDSISSSDAGDNQQIEIQGLVTGYYLHTDTSTLNGQTAVQLDTTFLRVFRMRNINTTDLAGHVFAYTTATSVTAGVPDDAAEIRAIMQPGNNQTEMAIYTIPAGRTGYMRSWYSSTAGANKNSNYGISLFARKNGGVFQLKHRAALSDNGTSAYQHTYVEPEVFEEKTDIYMSTEVFAVGATVASVSGGFDIVLVQD